MIYRGGLYLVALGGVFLPGIPKGGEAELQRAHGEPISTRGERILEDVTLMLAEVFNNCLLGVFEGFRVNAVIPLLEHDDLAEDTKTGVHATFLSKVF